jgi:hypothetical protein
MPDNKDDLEALFRDRAARISRSQLEHEEKERFLEAKREQCGSVLTQMVLPILEEYQAFIAGQGHTAEVHREKANTTFNLVASFRLMFSLQGHQSHFIEFGCDRDGGFRYMLTTRDNLGKSLQCPTPASSEWIRSTVKDFISDVLKSH